MLYSFQHTQLFHYNFQQNVTEDNNTLENILIINRKTKYTKGLRAEQL